MPYHNGYPIGKCPRCGCAQGSMSLCRICSEKELEEKTKEYEDDCTCPKVGETKYHLPWCKNKY